MITLDELETDYGTAILSDLTGEPLSRNRQPVRLFDQTKKTAEYYFRADEQGKPYIQNFAEGKRYYPLTAYCQVHQVDYETAKEELSQLYGLKQAAKPNRSVRRPRPVSPLITVTTPVDYLPVEVYARSRTQPERNGFYQYLCRQFDEATAVELFARYRIGTSRRWLYEDTLATCWPQFDTAGHLHQVKVIPFHPRTGRRAKPHQDARRWHERSQTYEPDEGEKVWFAGKALAGKADAHLQQCYFGEHLLAEYPEKEVNVVEGESTAVYCSARYPAYLWLATGGSTGGKWHDVEQFTVLKDRQVVLWPDSGKYTDWCQKAQCLLGIATTLRISRYVEDNAPAGAGNLDLRDLLTGPRYSPKGGHPIFGETLEVDPVDSYPADWDDPEPATLPTLIDSPNREEFAQLLDLPTKHLPLYRLAKSY